MPPEKEQVFNFSKDTFFLFGNDRYYIYYIDSGSHFLDESMLFLVLPAFLGGCHPKENATSKSPKKHTPFPFPLSSANISNQKNKTYQPRDSKNPLEEKDVKICSSTLEVVQSIQNEDASTEVSVDFPEVLELIRGSGSWAGNW